MSTTVVSRDEYKRGADHSQPQSISLKEILSVFFISMFCITLELFFTRLLNLKTSNHVVYVIIPFAILGYGVGANIGLIFEKKIRSFSPPALTAFCFVFLAVLGLASVILMIPLPLSVLFFQEAFKDVNAGFALSMAYLLLMLPFSVIGFLNLYIFSNHPKQSSFLYFWNLLGSGCGAAVFFVLIYHCQVVQSVAVLASVLIALAVFVANSRWVWASLVTLALGVFLSVNYLPEPHQYNADSGGWENFPKYFAKDKYETLSRQWHPLGRTDTYRLLTREKQESLYRMAPGTFSINLKPLPDYVYFSTNFLGGTPVYKLSEEGLKEVDSKLLPFSEAMEFPYVLLKKPKVVVIGAGGGRDIHFALSHDATEVVGAEINPAIYKNMAKGGQLYEYSGRIYERDHVKVEDIDGRHLVKNLPANTYDFIVLNGVDTFSGLSSGAYMYSESYLYTVNAVRDYFRILSDKGMINFNRWIFLDYPRETLRLFVIVQEALRQEGVSEPWRHIMVGSYEGWGMMLVKKQPFNGLESTLINQYFKEHKTDTIYPSPAMQNEDLSKLNFFDLYALALADGPARAQDFIKHYMFDISPITDDSPFFYKYYRLRDFRLSRVDNFTSVGAGLLVFLIQGVVLFNALFFCAVFIGLPLFIYKKDDLKNLPGRSPWAFIPYFALLGIGFMFVEIPLMQRFGLLLGSPIYSISVTLAALLIISGIGSLLLPHLEKRFSNKGMMIQAVTAVLILFLFCMIQWGTDVLNALMGFSFWARVALVSLILVPYGLCLGMFFPSGLQLIPERMKGAMAWAWGINCGFSVFGSMVAIILAQFFGFSAVLGLAGVVYLLAAVCYRWLLK